MKLTFSSLQYFLVGALATAGVASGQQEADGNNIFPYEYGLRDLDNGLRVLVINTGFPNVVSLQIPVQVGSRHETDAGLTGFAHFFEHMMFRGSANVTAEEFTTFYKEIGAPFNAYTTDDVTNYYAELPSQEHLERALFVEADRFKYPNFTEDVFKIEAHAVLGEYNMRVLNNPARYAIQELRKVAYTTHTYKHSTIGYIEDIRDMPNQYDYSKVFFERFYRPENTMVIIAGDLDINETSALVEKHWGDWERGERYTPDIPWEPLGDGHVYKHIEWNSTTIPMVIVAFHGPAFSDNENDMATIDAAMYYAFGESSEIHKKLVDTEQRARKIGTHLPDHQDPYLVMAFAFVYDAEDIPYVQNELLKTFASLRAEKAHAQRLADTISYLTYSNANSMDSSSAVAKNQVHYMSFTRDPETWNRVYQMYSEVTTNDVLDKANQYFTDDRLVVLSLAGPGSSSLEANLTFSIDAIVETMTRDPPSIDSVLLPSDSPLVDFNILFNVGAMDDPVGKEGLAKLTADMITKGGSTGMSYEQIKETLYPMATDFVSVVDKEITSFQGRTHIANLNKVYSVISAQLLHPAFDEVDLERIRADSITAIEESVRQNSQLLGSAMLSNLVYTDHPYGHLTVGSVSSLRNMTIDDVRQFYEAHYTLENVVLGLAGGFSDDFVNEIKMDLGRDFPEGTATAHYFPEPLTLSEPQATIVQRGHGATSVMFGCPIPVTPSDPDYAAIWLATSYFGQGMSSKLFQSIRAIRGLNYGASASNEARGANNGRQSEVWRVYLSETDTVERAHFAVRCAKYELDKMIMNGISEQGFNTTLQSLLNSVNLRTATQRDELGYSMDNLYYGITDDYTTFMKDALNALTLEDVNNAIRTHLSSNSLSFVFVTSDGEDLHDRLVNELPSLISYPSEQSEEVLDEDRIIQDYHLGITSDNIDIVAVDTVGEGESIEDSMPIDLVPEQVVEVIASQMAEDIEAEDVIEETSEDLMSSVNFAPEENEPITVPVDLVPMVNAQHVGNLVHEGNSPVIEALTTAEVVEDIVGEDSVIEAQSVLMGTGTSGTRSILGFNYLLVVTSCLVLLVGCMF